MQMWCGMRQFSPLFGKRVGASEQSGSAPCGPRPSLRKNGTWWWHGFIAVTLCLKWERLRSEMRHAPNLILARVRRSGMGVTFTD